jgi:hypothetical protein
MIREENKQMQVRVRSEEEEKELDEIDKQIKFMHEEARR